MSTPHLNTISGSAYPFARTCHLLDVGIVFLRKILILCTLNFSFTAFGQPGYVINIIGDVKKLPDSCKCKHLLNRDREKLAVQLTKKRWQNFFRDNYKNNSPLERKLVEIFFWKCGDYELAEREFDQMAIHAKEEWGWVKDSSVFKKDGENYTVKRISFYNNLLFDFAFGRAQVVANQAGKIVGFTDYYNFDKKPLLGKNRRKLSAELMTRFMKLYSRKTKPFIIYYGIFPAIVAGSR